MENPSKDLYQLVGGIIVHENRGIVCLETGFVKGRLVLAGAIGHVYQSRVKAWFMDGPVPKGIHLFVGLKVGDLLYLAQIRGILLPLLPAILQKRCSASILWVSLGAGSSRGAFGFDHAFEFQERRGRDPLVTILAWTSMEDAHRQELVKASNTRPVLTRIQLEAYRILDSGATNIARHTKNFLHDSCCIAYISMEESFGNGMEAEGVLLSAKRLLNVHFSR